MKLPFNEIIFNDVFLLAIKAVAFIYLIYAIVICNMYIIPYSCKYTYNLYIVFVIIFKKCLYDMIFFFLLPMRRRNMKI